MIVSARHPACCFSAVLCVCHQRQHVDMWVPTYYCPWLENTSPSGHSGKADVCGSVQPLVKGFICDQKLAWKISWVLCKSKQEVISVEVDDSQNKSFNLWNIGTNSDSLPGRGSLNLQNHQYIESSVNTGPSLYISWVYNLLRVLTYCSRITNNHGPSLRGFKNSNSNGRPSFWFDSFNIMN